MMNPLELQAGDLIAVKPYDSDHRFLTLFSTSPYVDPSDPEFHDMFDVRRDELFIVTDVFDDGLIWVGLICSKRRGWIVFAKDDPDLYVERLT